MEKETMGTVISVTKQWWLKVNRKPVRAHAMDGAAFPHTIKAVSYTHLSNNLNQVAIHAHTYGVYPEEIDGLKRDYEKLWGEVSKVLRELSELVAK